MNGYRLVDREGRLLLSLDDKDRLLRLLATMPHAWAVQTLEGVTIALKEGALENVIEVGRETPRACAGWS